MKSAKASLSETVTSSLAFCKESRDASIVWLSVTFETSNDFPKLCSSPTDWWLSGQLQYRLCFRPRLSHDLFKGVSEQAACCGCTVVWYCSPLSESGCSLPSGSCGTSGWSLFFGWPPWDDPLLVSPEVAHSFLNFSVLQQRVKLSLPATASSELTDCALKAHSSSKHPRLCPPFALHTSPNLMETCYLWPTGWGWKGACWKSILPAPIAVDTASEKQTGTNNATYTTYQLH